MRLRHIRVSPISEAEQHAALDAFDRFDRVFAFVELAERECAVDADFATWVEERIAARQAPRKAGTSPPPTPSARNSPRAA